MRHLLLLCFSYLISLSIQAQRLTVNGGILIKAEITLGNQNQWVKTGILGFGVVNYGDISIEGGTSFYTHYLGKRHTQKAKGLGYGYEVFALGGIGKNTDLLGSSISNQTNEIIFDPLGKGGFNGFGFGFEKEYLPGKLKAYSLGRGSILMRFSNADHSIQIAFYNDFRFGQLVRGQGTDFGATGSLKIGFSQYQNFRSAYKAGVGVELFTPEPDYTKTPENPVNSDDGRKNVWFTLPPYKDIFYANLYGYGTYQDNYFSASGRLGYNSQKLGAYVQNILHDGLGLNPRFPWDVHAKDQIYIELSGTLLARLPNEK